MSTMIAGARGPATLTISRVVALWSVVLLLSIFYCKLSAVIYEGGPVELHVSVLWALQTWLPWIALTGFVWVFAQSERYTNLALRHAPVLTAVMVVLLLGTDMLAYAVLRMLALVHAQSDLVAHIYLRAPLWGFGAAAVTAGLILSRKPIRQSAETAPSSTPDAALPSLVPNTQPFITVVTRQGPVDVSIDTLEAIESAGNYVELCLANGTTHLHRATLKDMLQLTSSLGWVQVHRTALVNRAAIRARLSGHRLKLTSGRTLTVGRTYRQAAR